MCFAQSVELTALREAHSALLEEATFYKRQAEQLERENKRLEVMSKGVKKTKKALLQQIAELEETIQRERRERAAMEIALSEAYSATLRDLVAQQQDHLDAAKASPSGDRAATKPQSARGGWFR